MDLSVVVPCYNVEATLDDQLSALSAQEGDFDWEVVVVDNRSTDGTRDIAEKWARRDGRIRVVEANEGQSISYARNAGVRAAHASAIAICDGDDIVGEGWVRAMYEALLEHRLVGGPLEVYRLNPSWLARTRGLRQSGLFSFHGVFTSVGGCNHGFRKEVWSKVGGYDESFDGSETVEDQDFSLRAWTAGYTPHHVPEARVHYRYRRDACSLWKQGRSYGRGRVRIALSVRRLGYRVPSLPGWKSWLWLVSRLPTALTPQRFKAWLWVAANRFGHLEGSLRYRTLHL